MTPVSRVFAVMALSVMLAVSAFAGIIHSPGATDPPAPPSEATSSTSITTTVLLAVISLIS
jgi:hypothetical protein